ncbi:MAG: curved DNA-binding protein [Candidatus Azotimanducaceae bacterium]
MDFTDYYEILGLEPTATQDEIKRAFKKLARKFHPDVSTEKDAQARFQEVSEAYEILKNAEKRAEYDQLRSYVNNQGQQPGSPGFQFDTHDFADNPQFEDILSSIFGQRGFDRGGSRANTQFRQPGRDVHYTLQLSLEEVHNGGDKQVRLRTQAGEKTIKVKIPVGINNGKELRLRGQGDAGSGGAGDLYLQVEYLPHRQFEVDGHDLVLVLPVAPWEAALGASIEVPTLSGRVKLRIPAESQNGSRLRLKAKGLSKTGTQTSEQKGDQIVVLKLINPPISTLQEQAAFEALHTAFNHFDPRAGV